MKHQRQHSGAAILAAVSLLGQPLAPLVVAAAPAGQAGKPSAPAAQTPAKPATQPPTPAAKPATQGGTAAQAPTATAAPVDGGWPRYYDASGGGSVLLYQPQISSWDNQKHLVAVSAVSYR